LSGGYRHAIVTSIDEINEGVTVEMLVKAAKNCQHCSQLFLDSEADHHDPKNMAVAVTGSANGNPRPIRAHFLVESGPTWDMPGVPPAGCFA